MPKFFDSPYFYITEDGWALRPGAPKEVQDEFDEYMKEYDEWHKGIDPDDDLQKETKLSEEEIHPRSPEEMRRRRRSDSHIGIYDENGKLIKVLGEKPNKDQE